MKNDCLTAALAELERHGIRDYEIARGSKHLQLRFRINGGPAHMFTVPGTPSDWRSSENTKHDLRGVLREIGVITPEPKPAPCRPTPKLDRIAELERRVAALEAIIETHVKQVEGDGR